MAVSVVTDTTHYMPRELLDANGIEQVSLYVNWPDGRQFRESEMDGFQTFYDELKTAKDLPTTSQPSVGDFLAVYEPLLARGDDVVSIHLAGSLSGTLAAAEQAREDLIGRGTDPGRLTVIDSATGCACTGYLALAAASAARAGATAPEVVRAALHCREDAKLFFAVDSLEFLRRGGRIGGASAYVGTALKIKPILTFESEILPVARVRTWSRAFEYLVSHLRERQAGGCDGFVVQHVQAPGQAERMVARGREIFGREPEFVSEIGAVVGTHVGPGLLGVSALQRDLLWPPGPPSA